MKLPLDNDALDALAADWLDRASRDLIAQAREAIRLVERVRELELFIADSGITSTGEEIHARMRLLRESGVRLLGAVIAARSELENHVKCDASNGVREMLRLLSEASAAAGQ